MFVKIIEKIDDHVIIYSALVGVAMLPFATISPGTEPLMIPLSTCMLGSFFWYICKAIVITSQTATRMRAAGEPLIQWGDALTEYDETKCRRIGEAIAKANRENK